MSKAIVINSYGSSEVLSYQEKDINEPSANEIQIRNTAIGVNYHDVYVRSGLYKTLALPGVPGCEASGLVEKTGANVKQVAKGMGLDKRIPKHHLLGYFQLMHLQ